MSMSRHQELRMRPRVAGEPEGSLDTVSRVLSSLCAVMPAFDLGACFLGGGSARAVLDHAYYGVPLELRDVDLYLIPNTPACDTLERLSALRAWLARSARASVGPVREKVRAAPDRARILGHGVHTWVAGAPMLSVSVLEGPEALDFNGIFDVDTILLELSVERPLKERVAQLRRGERGAWLRDRHQGYRAWRDRNPRIVHPGEVRRAPDAQMLRVVRTFGKVGMRTLSPNRIRELESLRPAIAPRLTPSVEVARAVLKILGDVRWQDELHMLFQLRVLRTLTPELHALLGSLHRLPVRHSTHSPGGPDAARTRALDLLMWLSEPASRALILAAIDALPTVYPEARTP